MAYRLTIPVMHCFDDRYAAPAAVAFLSMLEHGAKDCFFALYVVHLDITEEHQRMLKELVGRFENASLEFVRPNNRVDQLFEEIGFKGHFSKEVLFKLTVAEEFKQYSRMMIADVDVIYQDDVAALYAQYLDDGNYVVGLGAGKATPAWVRRYNQQSYGQAFTAEECRQIEAGVGGGFLIFNLEAMRKDCVVEKLVACVKANIGRLKQAEQDVINLVCAGRISYFPLRAMVCTYLWTVLKDEEKPMWQEAMAHPIQLHYALPEKPWKHPTQTFAHLWWACVARTEFYYEAAQVLDPATCETRFSFLGKLPILKVWHRGEIYAARLGGLIPLRRVKGFGR